MVCSQCGKQLVQNSMYCSSCGNKVKNQAAPPTSSSSNNSQNVGIDKNALKIPLFSAMFNDGLILVNAISAGNAVGMMFCTLFLAVIFYAYQNLQQNKYSEAKSYCLAGSLLNGLFAFSNISALNQISGIITFVNEACAAFLLACVYYELNNKIKD